MEKDIICLISSAISTLCRGLTLNRTKPTSAETVSTQAGCSAMAAMAGSLHVYFQLRVLACTFFWAAQGSLDS